VRESLPANEEFEPLILWWHILLLLYIAHGVYHHHLLLLLLGQPPIVEQEKLRLITTGSASCTRGAATCLIQELQWLSESYVALLGLELIAGESQSLALIVEIFGGLN